VATAVSGMNGCDRKALYDRLMQVARRKTTEADTKLDDRGRKVDEEGAEDFGDNVLIVNNEQDELGET
jgi:hypothetical protein